MSLKDTYNRVAKKWHNHHHDDTWWIPGLDTFISLLPKNGTVLDAGCGTGVKSKYLIERGLSVTGIDFAKEMLSIAKQEVSGAEFYELDITDAKKLGKTFDGILFQAVLLHIPKKDGLGSIKNLTEALTSGGYLCLATKKKGIDGVDEEVKKDVVDGEIYERLFAYYTEDELSHLFSTLGFEIVFQKTFESNGTEWVQMIVRKP